MGTFFLILFLIFIFYFVVRPVYRIWSAVKRAQKQQKDFINSMFGARGADEAQTDADAEANERARRKGGWSTPRKKRKKIDPEVGEFVKFKETVVSEQDTKTASDGSGASFTAEEQITDVTWEDLPPED